MKANVARRQFLQVALCATGALATSQIAKALPSQSVARRMVYRISPLPGVTYSPSFQRLIQSTTFPSFKAAVAAVFDRTVRSR